MEILQPIRYILFAILEVFVISFSCVLFYYRNRPFLKSRYLPIQHFLNISICIFYCLTVIPKLPCWLNYWSWWFIYVCLASGSIVRLCILLARWRIQQKLLEEAERFSRFERLFASSTVYSILAGTIIITLAFVCIASFVFQDNFYTMELKVFWDCFDNLLINTAGLGVIYSICFLILGFSIFFSKVKENLGIRTEIVITGVISVVVSILIVAFLYGIEDEEISGLLIFVVADFGILGIFSTSVILPIYWSSKIKMDSPSQSSTENISSSEEQSTTNDVTKHLESDTQIQEFKKFLVSEFSLENLLFIEEVIKFRASPSIEYAKQIARKFIGNKSRTPVNVPGPIADVITQQLAKNEFSPQIFDSAYQEIVQLLKGDSLRRFLKGQKKHDTTSNSSENILLTTV